MIDRELLRECVLFAELSDSELDRVAALAVEKEYQAGSTVFAAGDPAEELFVLKEGRMAVQMTLPGERGQAGRKITVDVVTRHEVAGWSAIMEPYMYTFTALCLQRTVALAINGEKLMSLLWDNPRMGYEVMKGLSKALAAALNDTRQVLISERLLSGEMD